MRFLLFVEHSFRSSRKPCLPGVAPRVIIADIRQMRRNSESIFRRFSHTIQVNSRHKSTEALNIRQVVCHVKKMANVKMFVGFLLVRSPGHWLRNIVGGEKVQHFSDSNVPRIMSRPRSPRAPCKPQSTGEHPIPRLVGTRYLECQPSRIPRQCMRWHCTHLHEVYFHATIFQLNINADGLYPDARSARCHGQHFCSCR